MIIIGVDYHPEFQQIASLDTDTGEFREARLQNREQAEQFYRELSGLVLEATCAQRPRYSHRAFLGWITFEGLSHREVNDNFTCKSNARRGACGPAYFGES